MIPSPSPPQLQGLTQIKEMLIARASLIMTVYIKPGRQRGYSGYCINIPQNVTELASLLPRYSKDLSVIIEVETVHVMKLLNLMLIHSLILLLKTKSMMCPLK